MSVTLEVSKLSRWLKAAAACGIDALFIEVHDNPKKALSDANTVLVIKYLENVLSQAKAVHELKHSLENKWGVNNVHAK